MSTTVLTLPLDKTGSASSNLVPNESHAIGATGTRAFPLNYGLFYGNSLVLKDASGNTLTPGTQYYAAELDFAASYQYGQAVYAVVIVVDTTVSATVSATYQAVGGPNSLNAVATQTAIAALELNDAPTTWANLTQKPKDYPPAPHYHQSGDVFGMEYIVNAIDRLATGITQGQGAAQTALMTYAQDVVAELAAFIAQGEATLQAHFSCFSNPHHTTAAQAGAYTTEQTTAAIATETTNRQNADAAILANLASHIANHNDPHQVTPAQVGGYTRAQSDAAMTAMQTAMLASIASAEATQSTHITDYSNPHQVTAAQIGTWTVSQITAAISTATNTIQSQVNAYEATLNSHIANVNNPHQDTVGNVGTWAQTTIQSGIVNPYSAHASNTANPHQDVYSNIITTAVDASGMYSATTMTTSITNAYNSIIAQINSLNGTISSHVSNGSNPHGDNVSNTGGAYTGGQLQYAISLLQGPGGSASNAINYLANVHN